MWFKTEEKNEEDNQDIQTLINKTVKETLAQFQQGNLNTYSNQTEKKKPKTNSLSSESTKDSIKTKWVSAREVAEIKGLKVQWARELMHKGYFGNTIGKATRHSPLKVLREVVENTELIGQGRPNVNRPFPSDKRDYTGRPKVNKKPKTKSLSKWVSAREIAEIKGASPSWASKLIKRGYFGKTTGKGKSNSPLKVLREAVENTELIGRGFHMKDSSSSGLRAINFNRDKKYETFKPTVNPLAYEDIKKQLMGDREFLSKVGSNVMSNLRFINKLDS